MLADEYGTASNIKSRVNRLSVLGAITSVQHRLKLYTKVPPNGLVVYCGTVVTDEGKEKKVNIDFEPFKPINTSLYLCDNKFHTEALTALLADDNRFESFKIFILKLRFSLIRTFDRQSMSEQLTEYSVSIRTGRIFGGFYTNVQSLVDTFFKVFHVSLNFPCFS